MFGWYFCLLIDVFFGMDINKEKGDYLIYVIKFKDWMVFVYFLVLKEVKRIVNKNKENYDYKVKFVKFEVGDRVFVRKVGI